MKYYTIGEVIDKFERKDDWAYCVKGEMKGTFITVDHDNDNRLTTIYPEGHVFDVFAIKLSNIEKSEGRQWVMVKEVEDSDVREDIENEYMGTLTKCLENGVDLNLID